MTNFIHHPVHESWHAHSSHVKTMLGLNPRAKLPDAGLPAQRVQNFDVWVEPLGSKYVAGRRMTHRVLARCLCCNKTMSAGRTHQHTCA
jgi:hypothetical protein